MDSATDLILALLWALACVIVLGALALLGGIVAALLHHFLGISKDVCLLLALPVSLYFGLSAIAKVIERIRMKCG